MDLRFAILLLRISGAPDKPSRSYVMKMFTAEGRGSRNLVDYFDENSHGNVDIGNSQVFGWMDYGHTLQDIADEWTKARDETKKALLAAGTAEADAETQASDTANLARRNKIVEWARAAAAANQAGDLSGFKGIVCIFNQPVDYFASPGETVLNWDPKGPPFTIDLTGVAHELGHNLGLEHSRRAGADDEYADKWDIMSAYGVYFDKTGTLKPPRSSYLTFGPGLNAVNMEMAGWLDQRRLYTPGASGGLQLRPLHRRDLPGWLAARIQLGYQTIYLEFRMKGGWDAKIPAHCILLHQRSTHPRDGNPCSELIVAHPGPVGGTRPDLRAGEAYEVGDAADPFAFYARIKVLKIDPVAMTADIEVRIREHRRVEPQGTIYGGVASDGGGLVWTPGRGFTKIPPHSPLIRMLATMAEYEALQSVDGNQHALEQLRMERLVAMRDQLSVMIAGRQSPRVPAPALQAVARGKAKIE